MSTHPKKPAEGEEPKEAMHDIDYKVRSDCHDEMNPYDDGDYLLFVDVVAWLMGSYDYARQEWGIARVISTPDALFTGIHAMRLNGRQLAKFKRLCRMMGETVEGKIEELRRANTP